MLARIQPYDACMPVPKIDLKAKTTFLQYSQEKLDEMFAHTQKDGWSHKAQTDIISHSFRMKGQATALGYHLFAKVAQSLSIYCDKHLARDMHRKVIVTHHLRTLNLILKYDIQGHGTAKDKELLAHLTLLIQKYHPDWK